MRFLKIAIAGLITAVAMLFSLFVAIGVAAIGVLVYLYLRFRGKSTRVAFGTAAAPRAAAARAGDVIDISATEVPPVRLER